MDLETCLKAFRDRIANRMETGNELVPLSAIVNALDIILDAHSFYNEATEGLKDL